MLSRPFLFYVINMVLSQLAVLLYVITGIILLMVGAGGFYWLMLAVIFSFNGI